MSLNAIHVHTMVFSNDKKKAKKKIIQLIEESDEDIIQENRDTVRTTKRSYTAHSFSESARGYRFMEVFIDTDLKTTKNFQEVFHHIVWAKLVPPHYYKNVERDESYNWRNHVHYF